ncbi:MAG: bifunctional oligoribonuclease/PAP phosphatase NrnA [Candidatus Pacebacteria bacterium]|nr:bifunctional oligoribonuclease/PAP phosphatase NrnA [Candidatus Paceibacterota bacterium]
MNTTTPLIREKAPLILAEIQKAKSILLHCHPSPDPDSVGSALAMKFAVEQLGKKATVIKGDSDIPQAFMHFPGAKDIVMKNFFEVDLSEFDLFLCLDTAALGRVSTIGAVEFPSSLKVVDIDHHPTNPGFGTINLIEASYPATAQILFDLFKEWNIEITSDIAANLFVGIYTDTGGLKFSGVTPQTFQAAGELAAQCPNFSRIISVMENSNTVSDLHFKGLALTALEPMLGGKVGLAVVSLDELLAKNIADDSVSAGSISSVLRTVGEFDVVGALIEAEPGMVRASFRSKDANTFDVSALAAAFGGGGHRAAAGTLIALPLAEAKQKVVEKIKELYNL